MRRWKKITIWIASLAAVGIVFAVVLINRRNRVLLQGAVIQQSTDTRERVPLAGVIVVEANGLSDRITKTDSAGFFSFLLRPGVKRGEAIRLEFRHPDYKPLNLDEVASDTLYVARMSPLHPAAPPAVPPNEVVISNVVVKYSIETTTSVNVGSAVKLFQVPNAANVPCNNRPPCSPRGKWKASIGAASLDAGEGNEFQNARVSCIAGPCPFTRIDTDAFSKGGRNISAMVRNWSETTTFLLQAEVFRRGVSEALQSSYAVLLGREMSFSLPAAAQGPSIEAEMDGQPIVFPLGPNAFLSWAVCDIEADKDQSQLYRCKLKTGYRFR